MYQIVLLVAKQILLLQIHSHTNTYRRKGGRVRPVRRLEGEERGVKLHSSTGIKTFFPQLGKHFYSARFEHQTSSTNPQHREKWIQL